jgi:N-acetyl sugar amidotransferase
MFPRHAEINYADYAPDLANPPTMYGLPQEVKFCTTCVISNQRPSSVVEFQHSPESKKPTIHMDGQGVCDACHYAEEKEKIDWEDRERQMRELCDKFRRTDGEYDCVISGSGGKDSFYTSLLLKNKYGMHPLTVTWAPHIYTDWGWHNFQAWIGSGFDNQLFTPNTRVHRLLTRLSTETLLHPFQPFILGQKNLAPKLTAQNGIKLVFYGESEAEFGNPKEDNQVATRDFKFYSSGDLDKIFLGGVSLSDLKDRMGLEDVDFKPYMPSDPNVLAEAEIEVHYMGFYEKWHPQGAYYFSVENGGFKASPERTAGTYSKYNSIDDKIDDLHYFTTFIKFGIGRATYDAAQEVRNKDITREEGVALAKRFDGEYPERFIDELFEYLSIPGKEFSTASKQFEQPMMDREYFSHLCDRFRPPHLWQWDEGDWSLRRSSWNT